MSRPNYRVVISFDSERKTFTARVPELVHCTAEGTTRAEAMTQIEQEIDALIANLHAQGKTAPAAIDDAPPSGEFTVKVSRGLHREHQAEGAFYLALDVAPKARGNGVGRAILADLERFARSVGGINMTRASSSMTDFPLEGVLGYRFDITLANPHPGAPSVRALVADAPLDRVTSYAVFESRSSVFSTSIRDLLAATDVASIRVRWTRCPSGCDADFDCDGFATGDDFDPRGRIDHHRDGFNRGQAGDGGADRNHECAERSCAGHGSVE